MKIEKSLCVNNFNKKLFSPFLSFRKSSIILGGESLTESNSLDVDNDDIRSNKNINTKLKNDKLKSRKSKKFETSTTTNIDNIELNQDEAEFDTKASDNL
jgi:hypothetical protein